MNDNIKQRPFPAKVAEKIDDFTIVINRGKIDGLHIGDVFLIYRQGKNIIDPETGKSLGILEIIIGKGKVIHVQEKMATLESATYIIPSTEKTVTEEEREKNPFYYDYNPFGLNVGKTKKTTYKEPEKRQQPFEKVFIGDLAKPI